MEILSLQGHLMKIAIRRLLRMSYNACHALQGIRYKEYLTKNTIQGIPYQKYLTADALQQLPYSGCLTTNVLGLRRVANAFMSITIQRLSFEIYLVIGLLLMQNNLSGMS